MSRHLAPVLLAALLATAFTGPVRAAAPAEGPAARATRLSQDAQAAYSVGEYDEAIALYMEAFDASPTGNALYNIAFIYERKLADPELAVQHYERVIKEFPGDADLTARARKRIAAIESANVPPPVDPTPPPVGPTPPPVDPTSSPDAPPTVIKRPTQPPPKTDVVPIFIAVGGGALLASGIVVGIVASGTHSDFESATSAAEKRNLQSTGRTQAIVADVLMVTGAVALGTGLILMLVGGDDDEETSATNGINVSPSVTRGGAMLSIGGSL